MKRITGMNNKKDITKTRKQITTEASKCQREREKECN